MQRIRLQLGGVVEIAERTIFADFVRRQCISAIGQVPACRIGLDCVNVPRIEATEALRDRPFNGVTGVEDAIDSAREAIDAVLAGVGRVERSARLFGLRAGVVWENAVGSQAKPPALIASSESMTGAAPRIASTSIGRAFPRKGSCPVSQRAAKVGLKT